MEDSRSKIRSSRDDHEMTRTCETWATMWWAIITTRTWLLDSAHLGSRLHSRVGAYVRCVESVVGLRVTLSLVSCCVSSRWRNNFDGDVVIGVGRVVMHRHHADTNTKCRVFSFRFVVHLCTCTQTVFYDFSSVPNYFRTAKTGHLRCCLHTTLRLAGKRINCNRTN